MEIKKLTFLQACKDFFGLKDGQSTMDFAKEVKALTEQDRSDIKNGLEKNGYEIIQAV